MLISNIIKNIQALEAISESNTFLLYILILIFTSIFTAIIIYRMKNIFLLLPIYLLIFLIYWYSFIDYAYTFTLVFLSLFLILFGINKYKRDKSNNNKTFRIWASTSIIYSILIISIAFFLPKSNDYITWPNLQQKIYNAFPIVENLRSYKEYNRNTSSSKLFNFSTSGFSEEDKDLGGPLILSEKKVMTVESYEPLYLRGIVKHLYTGKKWVNMNYSMNEYLSKQDFSFLIDSQKNRLYNNPEKINIKFDSFSSKTIFAPYKTIRVDLNKTFPILVNEDDIIMSTDGIYKDEEYSVEYLKPLSYNNLLLNGVNMRVTDLIDLKTYLELDENTVTDRTKQLTSSLVEDQYNDYDKAITIQNYLRKNYKYNLNVKELPEDKDFVDNFLFEEKEGYCTYFASAMAVMLRLEGIPTRYVEDYIVDEKIGENKYQVRQKHAHTWVEAFIEPVGWMSFEPTAAYQPLNGEEKEEEIAPDIKEEKPEDDFNPSPTPDEKEPIVDGEDINLDIETKGDVKLYKSIFLALFLILFLSLLLRILIRFIKYKIKENHISSLPDKDKLIHLYKNIIDLIAVLGFPLKKGETHFEFANRIEDKFINPKKIGIRDITSIFVRVKYSEDEPRDDELVSILEYRDFLNNIVKDKFGKMRYFYRKYIYIHYNNKNEIP